MLNTEHTLPTIAGDRRAVTEPPTAERRRGRRISVGMEVTVTTLAPGSCPITGIVENASTWGVRLVTDARLARQTLIRMQVDNMLVLGEVIYCKPVDEGYAVGLQLEQSLDLHELARILDCRVLSAD